MTATVLVTYCGHHFWCTTKYEGNKVLRANQAVSDRSKLGSGQLWSPSKLRVPVQLSWPCAWTGRYPSMVFGRGPACSIKGCTMSTYLACSSCSLVCCPCPCSGLLGQQLPSPPAATAAAPDLQSGPCISTQKRAQWPSQKQRVLCVRQAAKSARHHAHSPQLLPVLLLLNARQAPCVP